MIEFILEELVGAITTIWVAYYQLTSVTASSVGYGFSGIILLLCGLAFLVICVMVWITSDTSRLIPEPNNNKNFTPLLLLVVVALGIFMLVVTSNQGGGTELWGRSYKMYQVESYSKWMQNQIRANWDAYHKPAIIKNNKIVCAQYQHQIIAYLFQANPAFQSGCCKAPRDCKMCGFNNQTSSHYSIKLENYCNDNCNRWGNDPNTLCFDCESCKAGFLQDLTELWYASGLQLVIIGGFLLFIHIISNNCR